MVRSFIVLLLLVVFFLTGMLLGIDRGQNATGDSEDKIQEIVVKKPKEVESRKEAVTPENKEVVTEKVSESVVNVDSAPHFTQKMASFLEGAIKLFYDTVVLIVYQIAELFF